MKYSTKSEQDTQKLGESFGEKLRGGEVFLLTGDLGGGKTQFVKGLAKGMGVEENITSPTFTYENIYRGRDDLNLYHFDLYRNEDLDPDVQLLMEEAMDDFSGIVAIEWAERAKEVWPKKYKLIEFFWVSEDEREIVISEK